MRCRPYLQPLVTTTEAHISIVARMLSNLPSQVRQQVEFLRPMVEERFAKMEEFGDDWDKPVCEHIILVFLSLHGDITERYAHVADGRGQGSGEVPWRRGTAIARCQLCGYPLDISGER